MTGFNGITIETKNATIIQPKVGLKGLAIERATKEYIEPKAGFKGISVAVDFGGSARKIWHRV